jgi:hypothetical protein
MNPKVKMPFKTAEERIASMVDVIAEGHPEEARQQIEENIRRILQTAADLKAPTLQSDRSGNGDGD